MSGSVFRDYAESLTNNELLDLWNEIVDWEVEMSLPMDAKLREATRQAFTFRGVESHNDVGEQALMLQFFSHEVWREVARRGMRGEWLSGLHP